MSHCAEQASVFPNNLLIFNIMGVGGGFRNPVGSQSADCSHICYISVKTQNNFKDLKAFVT